MMDPLAAIALALLTPLALYIGCRIVFSAYFAAKRIYQHKLLSELEGGATWQDVKR